MKEHNYSTIHSIKEYNKELSRFFEAHIDYKEVNDNMRKLTIFSYPVFVMISYPLVMFALFILLLLVRFAIFLLTPSMHSLELVGAVMETFSNIDFFLYSFLAYAVFSFPIFSWLFKNKGRFISGRKKRKLASKITLEKKGQEFAKHLNDWEVSLDFFIKTVGDDFVLDKEQARDYLKGKAMY